MDFSLSSLLSQNLCHFLAFPLFFFLFFFFFFSRARKAATGWLCWQSLAKDFLGSNSLIHKYREISNGILSREGRKTAQLS